MLKKNEVIKKSNILVFPCGTEIGLEIHNSLKYAKQIELFGASSAEDHGKMVFKNYIGDVPFVSDDNFIVTFNKILKKYKIDLIFPAHDDVVLALAKLSDKLICEVVTSQYDTCDICRSKSKTYDLFPDISPKTFNSPNEVNDYPVFLKPDIGQGSQGALRADNLQELEFYVNKSDGLLISEYLPGKEYTVDCFSNKDGELLFMGMRERIRVRNGISVNSKTKNFVDEQVIYMANEINNKLKFRGVWFFQTKLDKNGQFKLLEIAPRVAGTMCLYRNNGVNFELLSVYDRLGYHVDIINNNLPIEVNRALTNRFTIDISYDTVYIDFDDTLVIGGKVNEYIMIFLYQCLNKNKKIILITKHVDNIESTLSKYRISRDIFSQVISLDKIDEKNNHMTNIKKSIFIDDSFSERRDVMDKLHIPCFDLDMVESLLDWKR